MLSTLIIIKKYDNTLLEVSKELVRGGEKVIFLFKGPCINISSLGEFGSVYYLNGDSSKTSIDYDGWVDLIEESNRIVVWS